MQIFVIDESKFTFKLALKNGTLCTLPKRSVPKCLAVPAKTTQGLLARAFATKYTNERNHYHPHRLDCRR